MIKNKLIKYQDIVSHIRIDHEAYSRIYRELSNAYDAVGESVNPVCLLITGESRTGKSSVVRELLETCRANKNDASNIQSIVYAVAPAKASVKSLLESLLKGLGDPYWSKGTVANMTHRLHTLLDAVHCKLIILDEFQHLCDKGQVKSLHMVADWLKVFLECQKYGLVAVGLPSAASIIHGHSQLYSRFDEELKMPLFNWHDKSSSDQFRAILRQFQDELKPFCFPNLSGTDLSVRFYLASSGRIGLVAKILERAIRNAIRDETRDIKLNDLKVAYDRSIWSSHLFPVQGGPFGADMSLLLEEGIQAAVLANAVMEAVADNSSQVKIYADSAEILRNNNQSNHKNKNNIAKHHDSLRHESAAKEARASTRARNQNKRDLRRAF